MDIKILHLIEGAKKAKGLTVIIDVFRAFSLEAYLLDGGAEKIIPLADKDLAYKLKAENPDMILAGERHGKILPGFDTGNAPSKIGSLNLGGKTVIHTTSAGTQGIANAIFADEILGAALVNAKATARYIKEKNPETVSLVCMGNEGVSPNAEDTLCAEYIKSLLLGTPLNMEEELGKLKLSPDSQKFFDPVQQSVFPKEDYPLCVDVDKFDFILKYTKPSDSLGEIKKVTL